MKFSREPAVWGALLIAAVSVFATWQGNPLVNGDQLPLVVAVVNAVVSAVVAWRVRPVEPAVLVGLVTAAGALLAGYGVDLPPALIGTVNALLVPALLGLVTRAQQTPVGAVRPVANRY
jgi:hypothetical protein